MDRRADGDCFMGKKFDTFRPCLLRSTPWPSFVLNNGAAAPMGIYCQYLLYKLYTFPVPPRRLKISHSLIGRVEVVRRVGMGGRVSQARPDCLGCNSLRSEL